MCFPAAISAVLLAASPQGPSFDCSKARGPDEVLVCADPELAAMDRKLAARFGERLAKSSQEEASRLRASQRSWLAERSSCTLRMSDGSAPTRALLRRCLETSYGWRIDDLQRTPEQPRLPAGVVAKRIVRRSPRVRASVDVSYPALAPGRAGASAFDAFFAGQAEGWIDEPGDEGYGDPDLSETSMTVDFTVPFASPRRVTVVSTGYEYGGGAHGLPFSTSTTFDVERGVPLTLDDVFAPTSGFAEKLLPRVLERLNAVTDEWEGATDNARKGLAVTSNWTFTADGAVVTFPAYAVAPYAAGMPQVRFTWEELRPLLRPNAPFPPATAPR